MQEDVRNIEAGKIPLPKYLASAEPVIASNGVSPSISPVFTDASQSEGLTQGGQANIFLGCADS